MPRDRQDLAPCGTAAAARRHYRHGEPVDPACMAAARQVQRERAGSDPYKFQEPDPQPAARNRLPIVPYDYGRSQRDPAYSWAVASIRRAEAIYGAPERDDGPSWDREAG